MGYVLYQGFTGRKILRQNTQKLMSVRIKITDLRPTVRKKIYSESRYIKKNGNLFKIKPRMFE